MDAYQQRLQAAIGQVSEFLKVGVWRLEVGDFNLFKRFLVHALRIGLVVAGKLSGERIHLRSAVLTFYSLLSVVPVLAMLFGLAKGFGLDRVLEHEILKRIEGQEEVVARLISFARNLLESTQGGVIAGVGVVVLFWSVINVFSSIEKGFNEMWGITKTRPLLRKATDYLSLSLFCAILAAVSSTLTVMITSEVTFFVNRVKLLETVSPAIFVGLKVLPMMVIWLLFTLIYTAIPNTRVRIGSAALGGILAGTAFQIFQGIYIGFQVGVAKYNAIYGSFAALPLFLVWLQLSWLIVLVGAQVSVACQNLDRLGFEADSQTISLGLRRLLTLLVATQVVKRFCLGEGASSSKTLCSELKVPPPLLQDLLNDLSACGLLVEVKTDSNHNAFYQPAIDPDRITIQYVIARLEENGRTDPPVDRSETFTKLFESMAKFRDAVDSSPANLLLKQL
jgi:membrane protein